MTVVAFAADKGSPGVTTAVVALAAVWPRRVLIAECDPSGGDIALRLPRADGRLPTPDIGLLSLATAARRGLDARQVWNHVQQLEGGLELLAGLATAEQASGLSALWRPVARALAGVTDADVFADCGRLGPTTPSTEGLRAADRLVLVTRATADSVVHLRERVARLVPELRPAELGGTPTSVVVVAPAKRVPAAADEVQRVLDFAALPVSVIGCLVHDDQGAAMLRGEPGRRLDRSLLVRSARGVAGRLDSTLRGLVAA
jgi:MinD-like ATPase involved in chromosome partitioning or flagellar assembly